MSTAAPHPEATTIRPSRSWRARNQPWLIALLPLLLAAIAVTGWRAWRILPAVEFIAPQGQGSVAQFHQVIKLENGKPLTREARIRALGANPIDSFGGSTPVAGAALHLVSLEFEADPSVPLAHCDILLRDATGTEYAQSAAKKRDYSIKTPADADSGDCVPPEATGPTFEFGSEEPVPSAVPRPRTWTVAMSFALPVGVTPTQVVVRWPNNAPEYAVMDLPR